MEGETFSSSIEYDALNRPTTITRPDSSKILPTYNETGMLESVEVKIAAKLLIKETFENRATAAGLEQLNEIGVGGFAGSAIVVVAVRHTQL